MNAKDTVEVLRALHQVRQQVDQLEELVWASTTATPGELLPLVHRAPGAN